MHLEYPPPVLPFVLAPKLITTAFESYAKVLGLLMGLCMVLSIALAIDVVRRARAPRESLDARWWLAAGLLLAQGALTIQRLNPLVALTMVATLRGAVRRSPVEMGLWAGFAGACKIVPLLVVPVMVAADWSFWRPRLVRLGAWTAAGLAIGFGPMFLASPRAVADLFRYHGFRGLQVESTLGALVDARIAFGTSRPATISYGSFNVDGAFPDALAKLAVDARRDRGALRALLARGRSGRRADSNRATRLRDPRRDRRPLAHGQGLLAAVPDVGNPARPGDPGAARRGRNLDRHRSADADAGLLPRLL